MAAVDYERAFARCSQRWATGTSWRCYARGWDSPPSLWQRLAARFTRTQ